MTPEVCIVFVCQKGELEVKASILAASLHFYNAGNNRIDWVVAMPSAEVWGSVSAATQAFLGGLGFRLCYIDSPFAEGYPIGNKIAAIGVETLAPVTLFLDSDIICLQQLPAKLWMHDGLRAKPADFNTFSEGEQVWPSLYEEFELPVPAKRVLSTVSQQMMYPYFNAGVIAVKSGANFSDCWLQVARQIDGGSLVTQKRPWLDQIALPIAAQKLGLDVGSLTEASNFPAHVRGIREDLLPCLCHYHSASVINGEPYLIDTLGRLLNAYPLLSDVLSASVEWAALLSVVGSTKAKIGVLDKLLGKKAAPPKKHDFLITGIPRSGTSLLCNLLHRHPNVVVINEPAEVFSLLDSKQNPNEFGSYYRRLRLDVLQGKAIENKLDGEGNVVEDTRHSDERVHAVVNVENSQFALGTKNPLAYLARLRWLCDEYPSMEKVVVIRHPYDCIASWVKSFPHLEAVDMSSIPFVGDVLDSFQRTRLNEIRATEYLPLRRALLWRYLADLISRDRDRVFIVRYEDLLQSPDVWLSKIGQKLNVSFGDAAPFKSSPRASGENLSGEEKEIIRLICSEQAEQFAYDLTV